MDYFLVHESVIQNKIPVVLLEGTGGCCDLFAKCYHLYSEYHLRINADPTFLLEKNEEIKMKIYAKLKIINDEMNDYSLEIEYFQMIYECIEKRMIFLNFIDFKVHSHVERDIDLAILQALLNGKMHKKIKSKKIILF
jgi:nucleoside-specific outer membrane channel protein Tsx